MFSLSPTKPFDLGRYAVGRSKSVKFDRPGIVRVFCDIHSHMSAFILVFAHRHFAVTDDEGRYRLDNVPPGTYTVIAWNESAPSESRRVVVPEAGATWKPTSRSAADEHGHQPRRSRKAHAMSLFSSLTNRIFFGSALLAVGSIAIAIYNVNVAVTRQAEQELRRGLDEAGTIIEEYRSVLVEHFTREARLIADLPRLKAAVDTNDPKTVQPMADDYQRQLTADLLLVTGRQGQTLAEIASASTATGSYASLPGVKSAAIGRESSSFWPHPRRHPADRVRAHLDRSAAARDPRHAQRRRQPRQQRGEPFQVADQQRNRVRR